MKLQRCHCPAHWLQPSPASHLPLPQLRGRGTHPRDGTFGPHFQFTKKTPNNKTHNPTHPHCQSFTGCERKEDLGQSLGTGVGLTAYFSPLVNRNRHPRACPCPSLPAPSPAATSLRLPRHRKAKPSKVKFCLRNPLHTTHQKVIQTHCFSGRH